LVYLVCLVFWLNETNQINKTNQIDQMNQTNQLSFPTACYTLNTPANFSRMLKKSASFVLASFRGSTYRSVRLTSSLAAALLDNLFEHPAALLPSAPT
jgi:hypothetical protein